MGRSATAPPVPCREGWLVGCFLCFPCSLRSPPVFTFRTANQPTDQPSGQSDCSAVVLKVGSHHQPSHNSQPSIHHQPSCPITPPITPSMQLVARDAGLTDMPDRGGLAGAAPPERRCAISPGTKAADSEDFCRDALQLLGERLGSARCCRDGNPMLHLCGARCCCGQTQSRTGELDRCDRPPPGPQPLAAQQGTGTTREVVNVTECRPDYITPIITAVAGGIATHVFPGVVRLPQKAFQCWENYWREEVEPIPESVVFLPKKNRYVDAKTALMWRSKTRG